MSIHDLYAEALSHEPDPSIVRAGNNTREAVEARRRVWFYLRAKNLTIADIARLTGHDWTTVKSCFERHTGAVQADPQAYIRLLEIKAEALAKSPSMLSVVKRQYTREEKVLRARHAMIRAMWAVYPCYSTIARVTGMVHPTIHQIVNGRKRKLTSVERVVQCTSRP